jgi:predicted DsbA family dithiol-disulfide isomerase
MRVEIYSDVACPWCYIGKARFERALEAFPGAADVEVVFRPYQLDPNAPTKAVPMLEYLERRFGAGARAIADRVSETARREGLTIDYDRGLAVNTLNAHRLLRLAELEGGPEVQREVAAGLFEAHFSGGRDVGDLDVLAEIAGRAGMDPQRVREYLASGEGEREVRAAIERAQRMGVSAVPTFVFEDSYAVEGAHPAPVFLQLLEAVSRETAVDGDGRTEES